MPGHRLRAGQQELIDDIQACTHDPLRFVRYAFPWGQKDGPLENETGPRRWQIEYLDELGVSLRSCKFNGFKPIRKSISSGHDIGKSALFAWLITWSMSTFEDTRGVITANTERQLATKTWPELQKWHRMMINRDWFEYNATSFVSANKDHEKTWRFDMVPWSERNTEAFAGLHNLHKRLLLLFDEASAIPDKIWEVSEGALTDEDTEILWCVSGNPTRNVGRFRQCFGSLQNRWQGKQIDSRTVEGTNKKLFEEWEQDYGSDSDFFRVRVRGMFPRASSLQFIPGDIVAHAMVRKEQWLRTDPLIMSLDIARGGEDSNVFRFRRGFDARTIPPIKIPGSESRDSMVLVGKAVELIARYKPAAFFYDGTGVGGPVGDRIRQLGHNVIEVQFGARAPDHRYANMRSYMWGRMREWFIAGGAIGNNDLALEQDLTNVEYSHNSRDQLLLEKKDHMRSRGLASPDDGDALAMTFAHPVGFGGNGMDGVSKSKDWDPLEERPGDDGFWS